MTFAELNLNSLYTYADYLKWQFEERVELLKGRIFQMAAPSFDHQVIVGHLFGKLFVFLEKEPCKVFVAPFDVRLPRQSNDAKEIYTVFQPDVCVVCDTSKYDKKGCIGAPDIIGEVLSPGNTAKELKNKFEIYQEAGVKEYWIIMPEEPSVFVYELENGRYIGKPPLIPGDVLTTKILPGFSLDVAAMFDSVRY